MTFYQTLRLQHPLPRSGFDPRGNYTALLALSFPGGMLACRAGNNAVDVAHDLADGVALGLDPEGGGVRQVSSLVPSHGELDGVSSRVRNGLASNPSRLYTLISGTGAQA